MLHGSEIEKCTPRTPLAWGEVCVGDHCKWCPHRRIAWACTGPTLQPLQRVTFISGPKTTQVWARLTAVAQHWPQWQRGTLQPTKRGVLHDRCASSALATQHCCCLAGTPHCAGRPTDGLLTVSACVHINHKVLQTVHCYHMTLYLLPISGHNPPFSEDAVTRC
jgi:hypothetical protein